MTFKGMFRETALTIEGMICNSHIFKYNVSNRLNWWQRERLYIYSNRAVHHMLD